MRPLTDEELEALFKKLAKYIGDNVKLLIDRQDSTYVFRYHKERVYYCSEELMKKAACIARNNLVSFGTCFGKFSKSGKFMLSVTSLDYIAPYAKYRIWLKSSAEQRLLYGNHVLKSGVGRVSEAMEKNEGLVFFSMNNVPIGFGTSAKSTADIRRAEPASIVAYNQADIGEYIRQEDTLT